MANGFAVDVEVKVGDPDDVPVERLRHAVEWVLERYEAPPESGVTVVITSDEEVQRLNKQFRGVDAPTDVLSFPGEPELGLEDEEAPYLGDLILALPHIRRQAAEEDHPVSDELTLAVVHGTLHLMGYDHDTHQRQRAMWSVQEAALKALGVNIEVPEFEFDDDQDAPGV